MENNFINAAIACQMLDCCKRTLLRYRNEGKLLEGIHWGRNPGGKVIYDRQALENLIACSGSIHSPEHQRFIQEYLANRPENQRKKAKYQAVVAN